MCARGTCAAPLRDTLIAANADPKALADKLEGHLPGPVQEALMATVDDRYARTPAASRAGDLEKGLEKSLEMGDRWTERVVSAPTVEEVVGD